jgi:hypothetical protein
MRHILPSAIRPWIASPIAANSRTASRADPTISGRTVSRCSFSLGPGSRLHLSEIPMDHGLSTESVAY